MDGMGVGFGQLDCRILHGLDFIVARFAQGKQRLAQVTVKVQMGVADEFGVVAGKINSNGVHAIKAGSGHETESNGLDHLRLRDRNAKPRADGQKKP